MQRILSVVMASGLGLIFGWAIFCLGAIGRDGFSSESLGGAMLCACLTGLFTAVALASD